MAYYEQGFVNVQDNFKSGSREVWRCYTYSATTDNSFPDNKALCILRYYYDSATEPDKHELKIVGLNSNVPFAPRESLTIYDNVKNFVQRNSHLKSTNQSDTSGEGVLVCKLPDYDAVTSKTYQGISLPSTADSTHGFRKTNLPIFTVTNDDFSALNNYIESGDDSGADNYEDLHPSTYHTTVWLDGKFPNLFYKTELTGTTETQFEIQVNYDTGGSSTGVSYTKTYDINSMINATYSEYGVSPTGLSNKTTYYMRFLDENAETALQDACWLSFTVDRDGNVADITTTDSLSGNYTISCEQGTPSDTDYPEDDPAWNHTINTNNMSGANTLTKTYMLNDTQLRSLGNFLWSSTFKDNLLGLVNYPLENVISLKAMPLSRGGTAENIKIGNVDTGISAPLVDTADRISVFIGQKKCPRIFQNFLDYTAVDISIYLPFIGFKKLDNALAMDRTISVTYYFDVILGTCLALISYKDKNSELLACDVYQGNCGIDIAIASTNRAEIENGYINNAISGITNLISGNIGGAVKDAFNASTQSFHSESGGVGNPSLMGAIDMTCRLIIRRPKKFTPPDSYGHTFGYPCHKYGLLSDFSYPDQAGVPANSFTVCENFIPSLMDDVLDEEKIMIKELLETGVYL